MEDHFLRRWIVKRKQGMALAFILCLMTPALTFASDRDIVKLQGVIMAVDLKKNIITVNERSFALNKQTAVYNERGLRTTLDSLKEQGWVYIEGVHENRGNLAKKIYVLPGYISGKEKHLYSFFE